MINNKYTHQDIKNILVTSLKEQPVHPTKDDMRNAQFTSKVNEAYITNNLTSQEKIDVKIILELLNYYVNTLEFDKRWEDRVIYYKNQNFRPSKDSEKTELNNMLGFSYIPVLEQQSIIRPLLDKVLSNFEFKRSLKLPRYIKLSVSPLTETQKQQCEDMCKKVQEIPYTCPFLSENDSSIKEFFNEKSFAREY